MILVLIVTKNNNNNNTYDNTTCFTHELEEIWILEIYSNSNCHTNEECTL